MSAKPASELLYDSEATLRLVDSALDGLREPEQGGESVEDRIRATIGAAAVTARANGELGLIGLSQLLMRGYAEIVNVLDTLRESRTVLEKTAVDRIQHTHSKIREVTSATESAATSILDGLDRASALVDRLDRLAADGDGADSAAVRAQLREELFALIGHMQFQDITSQQLNYASTVLTDTEARLAHLAALFDPTTFGSIGTQQPPSWGAPVPGTFDPNASTLNAEARQAIADEVVRVKKDRL